MSIRATDSGLRVLTARAISAAASPSQVAALRSPVLVSMRDLARSWACIMNRRASSTVGTAKRAKMGLRATTTVIRTARSSSAKSACSVSRFTSRWNSGIRGSESLIAQRMSAWWPRSPTISHAVTASAQVRACFPVPIAPPAKDAGNARNKSPAAPKDKPMAAAVNTRR